MTLLVHSFFLRMYKIVYLATPKVSSICLIGLVFFFFFKPNDGLLHLHQHFFAVHIESYNEQLSNAISTLEIRSRPFNCFIIHVITREQATPSYEMDKLSIAQLFLAPENEVNCETP